MTRAKPSPAHTEMTDAIAQYSPSPVPFPPQQSKLLYTPTWTAAHDQCFIDALWDAAADGNTHEAGVNVDALGHATHVVNLVMKEAFTTDQNKLRLHKLRERYETFRFLIARPEVFWDKWDNTMHAPSKFWEEIVKVFPLAKAYERFGEPNWGALKAIFHRQSLPGECSSKTIDEAGPSKLDSSVDVEDIIDVEAIVEISSDSDK